MTIFVSAGHHAHDPGAIFPPVNPVFIEHDEALAWRDLIVAAAAARRSSQVIVVPDGELSSKIAYINERCRAERSVAIEVHFNAGPSSAHGCETLHALNSEEGLVLAEIVHRPIARLFQPDRGIKVGYFRMDPKNKVDAFLRETHCPAIIIEPEFVAHHEVIRTHRAAACAGIADALIRAEEVLRDTT